ncbi:MAG: hypothetical protein KAT52_08700 [Desulfobacterales bacterium]|nr:hypothetical protein [Desulfobacterales bacterium]
MIKPYFTIAFGHIGDKPKTIKLWSMRLIALIKHFTSKINFASYPKINKDYTEDGRIAWNIQCRVL